MSLSPLIVWMELYYLSNNCQQQVDNFYYCDSVLTTASPTTAYTGSTGGSVSVRGYLRKNGTYVHSHTRRSPRRR